MVQKGILTGLGAFILITYYSVFSVHMTKTAILLQMGRPVKTITEPGLHFKIPFIQQVKYFPSILLSNDSAPAELITKDKKKAAQACSTFFKYRCASIRRQ